MSVLPITLAPPVLPRVMAGDCTALRRPAGPSGRWQAVRPGDLLWVREPYHLPRRFGRYSPTAAAGMGARPIFLEDARLGANADIGPRRIGYTLPRAWHRQHLVVTAVRRERLQAITDAEIAAEGWTGRDAYAAAWERALLVSMSTVEARAGPSGWRGDPEVVVVEFRHVGRPLPDAGARLVADGSGKRTFA